MSRIRLKSLEREAPVAAQEAPYPQGELFTEAEWRELADAHALTGRQCEVVRLMCTGCDYKAIAARVGISINTVRIHMQALFMKLGAHDRVGVILQLIGTARKRVWCARDTK